MPNVAGNLGEGFKLGAGGTYVTYGEGGIRTPERGQPPLRDFQSRPFNRSGTSPGDAISVPGRGYLCEPRGAVVLIGGEGIYASLVQR